MGGMAAACKKLLVVEVDDDGTPTNPLSSSSSELVPSRERDWGGYPSNDMGMRFGGISEGSFWTSIRGGRYVSFLLLLLFLLILILLDVLLGGAVSSFATLGVMIVLFFSGAIGTVGEERVARRRIEESYKGTLKYTDSFRIPNHFV